MTSTTTPNVDLNEIAKFSESAHQWWDVESEYKPLHLLNPVRLQWIQSHQRLNGLQVLDVGCGGGILSESMAREGAQVLGIDLAAASLNVAQLHALEAGVTNVTYQEIAVEALAQQRPQQYDVVTCMEMLEHVPDPLSIVRACSELVKPGGWVFFSTINRTPKAFVLAIVTAEYIMNLLTKGTHEYKKFIKPSELSEWVRAAQLSPSSMMGVQYNPLTQRFSLSSDCDVNYMLACQKPLV